MEDIVDNETPEQDDRPCEVFSRLLEQVTREQGIQIALLCWSLWNRRNKWVWDGANGSAFGVVSSANHFLRDRKEAQAKDEKRKIRGALGARVWSKPKEGWLKINIDAAVFLDGSIGVSALVRDDQARFVAARGRRIPGAWQPREAEALGLKEALSWIINKGYHMCIIETDSYVLAAACNDRPGEAMFGTIVKDCIHLFKHINPVLIDFVYSSANNAAHVLAQTVYSMSGLGEWYTNSPNFITHALYLDLS
ncbi:hypothetical protein AgCh_025833 [Apium graveolens]